MNDQNFERREEAAATRLDGSTARFNPALPYTGTVAPDDSVTLTDANGKTFTQKIPGAWMKVQRSPTNPPGLSVGFVGDDIEAVSLVEKRAAQLSVPLLCSHDHTRVIGFLDVSRGGLEFEFASDQRITREQMFNIFGGAGVEVLEQEITQDETYIKRGRIYEFSLCPAMQGATE